MTGPESQAARGQSLVELALVFPFLTVFTFAALQFVILFLAYLSLMSAAWDVARWVVVHPHTTDSQVLTAVGSRLPPNLVGANTAISMTPSCGALVNGKCPGRDPYTRMTFRLDYNAASIILLPTRYGCCGFVVDIPTALPSYSLHLMVEPS